MNPAPRSRSVSALAVLIAAWGLAVASIALAWVFSLPAAPVAGTFLSPAPPQAQARFDDIGVAVAFVYAPLAAVLLLRRPQPVALVLGTHAVGSGLAAFGVQYGLLALEEPDLPMSGLFAYAGGWAFVPGTFLTAIVPLLLLPDRRSAQRRVLVRVVVIAAAVATVASMTHQGEGPLDNPLAPASPEYQAALPGAYAIAAAIALCSSLVVAGILAREARGVRRDERSPLLWLLVGHVFLTASYIVTVLPASLQLADPIWVFGTIAPIVGQIFYPSAVLVMGLQHRLRGIDIAVSAVLTTSILAVLAVGGYLLTVTVLEALGPPTSLAVFTTAAVIAVSLLPARRLIHRRVDRLVYGESGAPERLVHTLGAEVGEIATGADGLRALASALRRTLRLGSVRISTVSSARMVEPGIPDDDSPGGVGVLVGDPQGAPELFTLRTGDGLTEAATVLAVTGTDPDLPVGRRARETIADLAPVIGVVVQLAAASTSLDAARRSAADARHAERRALRRELHDGLGPALAGAGFSLAAAANLLARGDRPAAEATALGVGEVLDTQTLAVAGLARGGTAPVHDLVGDLQSLVASFAGAHSTVSMVATDTLTLDPRRSGILLRIAAEAILNAVRHAGGAAVAVTLGGPDGIVLRVHDDGRGLGEHRIAGVGLTSMREWAQEAGFEIAWEQPVGGGTLVQVRAADLRGG